MISPEHTLYGITEVETRGLARFSANNELKISIGMEQKEISFEAQFLNGDAEIAFRLQLARFDYAGK